MRVVEVNYKAVLTGAYSALPYLKKTPGSLMFSTSSSSGTYGMPRIAVYSSTKHAVKGLTEALSVEWHRHGVRVADVLPGLIDTAILTRPRNHSDDGGAPMSADELRASAPKKGLFRLMPASSVAEAAWQAYHHPKRLHWYVPKSIRMIDLLKGLSPEFVRGRIVKSLPGADAEAVVKERNWCAERLVAVAIVVAGVAGCAQRPDHAARGRTSDHRRRHAYDPPRRSAANYRRTGPSTSVTVTARSKRWCCSAGIGPSRSG